MSIRSKLTITFLAIALIPLLFVSAITFSNYKDSLEANQLSNLEDLAKFKADKIETYFANLKIYFGLLQVEYVIKKNLPVLTRLAGVPDNPEFIAAKHKLGGVYGNLPSNLGIFDIMLTNPEGKIVYSSNPDHSQKEFLQVLPDPQRKAFNEGKHKIYFSNIFFTEPDNGRPRMLAAGPVLDFNGNFIGVIAADVDLSAIYTMIQDQTGLGKTGETLIGKKEGDQVIFLNPLKYDPQAALKRRITIGAPIGCGLQKSVQGLPGAGQFIDYRGKRVVGAWRYIPSLSWGMVAKIDADEAFADIENLKKLVFLILWIVIILSVIMAVSITQSIAGPIKKLSKGAQIIGSGNLDYKVETNTKDEIGQLAMAFDKMVQDVKKLGFARDTERKRLYGVLETLPVYVVLLSEDYHVPFANKTFRERFGESGGKRCYEYLFNRTEPCENCETYKVLKTNAPHQWEWTGPDGRNYDIYDFPFIDTDGFRMILEMGIDITERKQAEAELKKHHEHLEEIVTERTKALRESQENLNRAQAVGNIGSWRLDTRKNELTWSDENHRIFAIPKGTPMTYETFLSTVHPDDRGYVDTKWKAGLAGEPYDIEHRIIVDGQVKWVREKAYLEFDSKGELLGGFGITQDITKRKQMEIELKRSNENLEQFAYVASHDLQEPLRITASFSELLRRRYNDKLDTDANEFIGYIVDGSKHMERLINDLLAYSRVGRSDIPIGEIDCNVILERVISSMLPAIEKNKPVITHDELPTLAGSEINFIQLFQNLIGNAMKFHGPDLLRVHVSAEKQPGYWMFSVRDNGIGIEPQYKDRIFLIFQRLHERGKYPGTGMGLAICKKIVETQGGRIWVESEYGRGSIFYFTIPVKGESKNE